MEVYDIVDSLLSEKELALGDRLNYLIEAGKMKKAWTLLEQILPKFWKKDEVVLNTLHA